MAIDARRPAHFITVLNLKGGVGKTHAVWLLASVCQERQKRILLIDTDTQGNLSTSFADRDGQPGVEALFDPAADASPEPLAAVGPANRSATALNAVITVVDVVSRSSATCRPSRFRPTSIGTCGW